MCNNVLLNLSINTALKSLSVEYSFVSFSLSKDLNVLLQNSLPLSTHNFSGFRLTEPPCGPSDRIVLNPLVIDKPDLFFNVIAHAYFVTIFITVKIN